jgi:hypothetical protein
MRHAINNLLIARDLGFIKAGTKNVTIGIRSCAPTAARGFGACTSIATDIGNGTGRGRTGNAREKP